MIKKLYNKINVDLAPEKGIFTMEEAELIWPKPNDHSYGATQAIVYGRLKENILDTGKKAKCRIVLDRPVWSVQEITEHGGTVGWLGFHDVEVLE